MLKPVNRVRLTAISVLLATVTLAAQELTTTVEFHFADQGLVVPMIGARVELLPVMRLVGASAAYSPAAGTYGVVHGDHFIQFAPDRQFMLVDGDLREAGEKPVASPGGVAASVQYLERALLGPLGFHLQALPGGYVIEYGTRYGDPVTIRPAAADFGATTTLVLTLSRPTPARVVEATTGDPVVLFADASPQLDATVPFRSGRVLALRSSGQDVEVKLASGVGVLSWHALDDPPRIILELGRVQPTPTPAPPRAVIDRPVVAPIVIDPGHGGDDTGAVGSSGLMEKELVLAISRRLARLLQNRGHTVRLTRGGDDNRALTDRTAVANKLQARLFVSLHSNSSTVRAVQGAETYYMSLDQTATDEAAAATAELENLAGGEAGERSALDLILWDLAQADVLNESAQLALAIQARLNARLGLRDRGVKQAPFVVLTGATMPAVLIEVGFLSNPEEERKLRDADYQQSVAEAIASGIGDYVGGS